MVAKIVQLFQEIRLIEFSSVATYSFGGYFVRGGFEAWLKLESEF
jgi:hypothetical protein